jgi:cytochrome c-type biogenesis protein CcmH/NrfG
MNERERKTQAWTAQMNAGSQAFRQGKVKDAAMAFAKATQLLPDRAEGWINLGSCLLAAQRTERAIQALERALSIKPGAMAAHMLMGDAMRQAGKSGTALKHYELAVEAERAPAALNRLACALRQRKRWVEARALYDEALQREPGFSISRVNLACMEIEQFRFDSALEQLQSLANEQLPPMEHHEVDSALAALQQYDQLAQPLSIMARGEGLEPAAAALAALPKQALRVDEQSLRSLRWYVESSKDFSAPPPLPLQPLPEDWPMIEGLHMIPLVNSPAEYLAAAARLESADSLTMEERESVNMADAVIAARAAEGCLADPLRTELHLRHWHALAVRGVEGFMPGHFKYTQNWSDRGAMIKRVDPAMAVGTLRHTLAEMLPEIPPGLARAAFAYLVIADLHPFRDGNSRVALTWMNRELEWAGLMPVLFSLELGLKGRLGEAVVAVRNSGGELAPLLDAIIDGQAHARAFCDELAAMTAQAG